MTTKMTKTTINAGGKKKLSLAAIAVSGLFCALLLLVSVVAIRHIQLYYSPSAKNSERLLLKGKPQEALAQIDKMLATQAAKYESSGKSPAAARRSDAQKLLLRGKALFAILMEQLREERWGSYGVNPDNWLAHPLAEEAEKDFLDAMAISPNNIEIRLVLGNLYREQGRFADAEKILRSALDIDGSNAEALLTLGLLYAEGSRPDAARKALHAAWELDEGNPKIAKNIAYFYRFYGDSPQMAAVWFRRYFETDPNPRREPDVNRARADFRDLLERYPEFAAHENEAQALFTGIGARKSFKR